VFNDLGGHVEREDLGYDEQSHENAEDDDSLPNQYKKSSFTLCYELI
jgi:hypothetical protein